MNLRESELNELALYPLAQNDSTLTSALVGTRDIPQCRILRLLYCTIPTTPEAFHNAISVLSWDWLTLTSCHHSFADQKADGATETPKPIDSASDFGIRLEELLSYRVEFITVK
ncbi:hypothetical protein BDV93DRAFT_232193 [Ceratobasidium sp. AG-I]|nr:hypothetical protein BDV93DRAFT_232193 [Ceratobasidium sp. AG-I]